MNRIYTGLLMLAGAAALISSARAAYPEMIPLEESSLVGRTAPAVELKTLTGESFSLEQARAEGKVVVMAFWASWCGPCRRELPALKELEAKLSGAPIEILLVNVDKEASDARRFLRQVGLNDSDLTVAMDNEAVALGSYGVMSMPTTFLIDRNGTVKLFKVGYSDEKGLTELEDAISGALR